jgi:hypothetical protein
MAVVSGDEAQKIDTNWLPKQTIHGSIFSSRLVNSGYKWPLSAWGEISEKPHEESGLRLAPAECDLIKAKDCHRIPQELRRNSTL